MSYTWIYPGSLQKSGYIYHRKILEGLKGEIHTRSVGLSSVQGSHNKNRRLPYSICAVCAQLCPTLRHHGLHHIRLLCPWNFPGKNTGVSCCFLLQGIFLTQESNLCLLHWQVDSLPLVPPWKPLLWSIILTIWIVELSLLLLSCSATQSVTPWTVTRQVSLPFTISQSLLKLMSIESVMPSNHLILCHPGSLLPSIFPSIRVFSNESVLHTRWSKFWSFSFSISPSNEGLPNQDWFPLGWTGWISLQSKVWVYVTLVSRRWRHVS